jgi:hypothetical protein
MVLFFTVVMGTIGAFDYPGEENAASCNVLRGYII